MQRSCESRNEKSVVSVLAAKLTLAHQRLRVDQWTKSSTVGLPRMTSKVMVVAADLPPEVAICEPIMRFLQVRGCL